MGYRIRRFALAVSLTTVFVAFTGCVTVVQPTIAHVHIGHGITGWYDTPDKQGLFTIAEKEGTIALQHAAYAVESGTNLKLIKIHIGHVINAINPAEIKAGPGLGYGMLLALGKAADHIAFAADSDDSSENVRRTYASFSGNAKTVIERCTLILAIAREVLKSGSGEDAAALAAEILELARHNMAGLDADGDGVVGSISDEYGLKQLRRELSAMIARERPPYEPVEARFLFGLVRLSSGKWAFSTNSNPFDDSARGSGGGGGGGGGY